MAEKVQIEQTSKTLKLQQLLSIGVCVIGVICFLSGLGSKTPSSVTGIGVFLFVGGFIWGAVVKFLIWWHHR